MEDLHPVFNLNDVLVNELNCPPPVAKGTVFISVYDFHPIQFFFYIHTLIFPVRYVPSE